MQDFKLKTIEEAKKINQLILGLRASIQLNLYSENNTIGLLKNEIQVYIKTLPLLDVNKLETCSNLM